MRGAGKRNRLITIQHKDVTRDALGGEEVSWLNWCTIWAQVTPLRGDEYYAAKQLQAESAVRFTILYRAGVSEQMRIVYDGKHYDITDVIDVNEAHIYLELMTREGLTDG